MKVSFREAKVIKVSPSYNSAETVDVGEVLLLFVEPFFKFGPHYVAVALLVKTRFVDLHCD